MAQVSPRKKASKGHSNANCSLQKAEENEPSSSSSPPLTETRSRIQAAEGFSNLRTPSRRVRSDPFHKKTIRALTPEGSPAGRPSGSGSNAVRGYLQDTVSSAAKRSASACDATGSIRWARQRLASIDHEIKTLREKRQQTHKLLEALGASMNEIRLEDGEGIETTVGEP